MTADGTGATFAYDVRNRLAGASTLPSFVYYEPQGRLSFIVGTTAPQVFDYVGDALVFESSAFGATYARYVHGPGTDEPIVWYDSGTVRYLHADERGTIVAVSNAAGNLTDIAKFDEYGVPQSAFAGRFGYTGQMWLPELGLYHYKARQYHPRIGRFMQVDPIGYQDQINLYPYVGNDPVNLSDPSGLQGETEEEKKPKDSCGSRIPGHNRCSGISGTDFTETQRMQSEPSPKPQQRPRSGIILAGQFNGIQTFGDNPTLGGRLPRFYPDGRLVSGLPGGHVAAWSDLDRISRLNGVIPPANLGIVEASPGWTPSFNVYTGYTILTHTSKLELRFNGAHKVTSITIPVRFYIAKNVIATFLPETVHYRD